MYYPNKEEFIRLSKKGNLIPVYKEISADFETPLSAFMKIDDGRNSFLLESIEGEEKIGRYSFLGSRPSVIFESKGRNVTIIRGNKRQSIKSDPLVEMERLMKDFKFVSVKGLPRFCGGLVGYIGYDIVRFIEDIPDTRKDDLNVPDSKLFLTDTIVIFDRVSHTIKVVSNAHLKIKSAENVRDTYNQAIKNIDSIISKLSMPLKKSLPQLGPVKNIPDPRSNMTRGSFRTMIIKAKKYIKAGDIIQTVLSQRFSTDFKGEPINIYRALRSINPSPYMFYLSSGDIKLIGSSPEIMVRGEDGMAEIRPIAGTRPRGKDAKEDKELERELLSDPKECAEHIMLVDLGRNDLGRVCAPGSIKVNELMAIERYSQVMHIVSDCTGKILPKYNSFDLLKASFPAGTVSGAPKIRAMEIIDELEKTRRTPYAGCVGYFSFSGNLDTCITIRTILLKGKKAYVQAGAGIVADSNPKSEYQETVNKAKAMFKAIAMADKGKRRR